MLFQKQLVLPYACRDIYINTQNLSADGYIKSPSARADNAVTKSFYNTGYHRPRIYNTVPTCLSKLLLRCETEDGMSGVHRSHKYLYVLHTASLTDFSANFLT